MSAGPKVLASTPALITAATRFLRTAGLEAFTFFGLSVRLARNFGQLQSSAGNNYKNAPVLLYLAMLLKAVETYVGSFTFKTSL